MGDPDGTGHDATGHTVCKEFSGSGKNGAVGSIAAGDFQPGVLYNVKVYNRTDDCEWHQLADFDMATLSDHDVSESAIYSITGIDGIAWAVSIQWKYSQYWSDYLESVFVKATNIVTGEITYPRLIDLYPEYPNVNAEGVYDDKHTINFPKEDSRYSLQVVARHFSGNEYTIGEPMYLELLD